MTQEKPPSYTRESQREAQALREELASTRIAMAKQAATLESLQEEVEHLRTRESELMQQVRTLEARLEKSHKEAATTRQKNAELEARAQAIPQLMQLLTEFRTVQGEIQQTLATLTDVADELTWNQVQLNRERSAPIEAPRSASSRSVQVKAGDTLWKIAREFGVSVPALKRANGLTTDLIQVGQELQVPAMPHKSTAPAQVETNTAARGAAPHAGFRDQ